MLNSGTSKRFLVAVTLSACVSFSFVIPSIAERPAWSLRPYSYVLVDQDIRDALKEFGHNLSIPVTVSDKIRGRVRGKVQSGSALDFLERLADANGLIWYYDGAVLFVYASEELTTQLLDLGRANGASVLKQIDQLSLMDSRFSIKYTPDAPMLRVSGPPAFIDMVKQVIRNVQPPQMHADDPRVRIFRGGKKDESVDDIPAQKANASTTYAAPSEQRQPMAQN